MPCRLAATIASSMTSGVVSESAGEDAAGVEPARPERAEEVVPVDVAGRSWLAAVWPRSETPTAPRMPKPALGEVEPVADGAADAVEGHPPDRARCPRRR